MNKKLLDKAEQILKIELELQTGFQANNESGSERMKQLMSDMNSIANDLTMKEMAEIDEYIQKVLDKCSM